ncbi:M20 family metallopeptidase [Candidatus Omnitrophota bacterium]
MKESDLLKESFKIKSEIIKIRRQIHAYPELGFGELKTARLIARKLKSLGLTVQEKVAQTGVIGILKGGKTGKTVAVRTDMDALPIQERTGKKYASKIPGVMHACGHDGKIAIALGVAHLLSKIAADKIKGQVKFVFQPNEEGSGGAQAMIAAGALRNPRVDSIFGFDLSPSLDSGKMYVRKGIVTANIDDFEITVIGKGGHAAQPWKTVNPILVAAKIVEALHSSVSRQQNFRLPAVISIGEIHGGTASNIIPHSIRLKGTARTLDLATRKNILRKIKQVVDDICRAHRAQHQLQFIPSYPSLANNAQLNDIIIGAGEKLLGPKNICYCKHPFFEGEDISYFFKKIPGAIFSIGIRNRKKGIAHLTHSPFFDLDEAALPIGVAIVAGSILRYLKFEYE